MGQYWYPVNLDKKEFLNPHRLGCGLKLREQSGTANGTGAALLILCAAMPEPRGGGDFKPHPAVGRWAGDRIALVGDYSEDRDMAPEHKAGSIYNACEAGEYEDISEMAAEAVEIQNDVKFTGDGWRRCVDTSGA